MARRRDGRRDGRPDDALVVAAREGDRDAFAELFSRWFDRVYDVARNVVRSPETAADVAQEAFIAAWTGLARLERPEAFGGWLLRITRNRALDRVRREGRSTSLGVDDVTNLHDSGLGNVGGAATPVLTPDEIVAMQDRDGLIAAAAVALGERDASLLNLHLRHGLSPAEIAEELGVAPNNAHQLLFRMRKRLGEAIGAFVLWRRGRPACPALANALAGVDPTFDQAVLAIVEQHARGCIECEERRAALVVPEQLFSAIPLVAAPAALRTRVIDGLRAADVPVPHAGAAGRRRMAILAAAVAIVIGLAGLVMVWLARGGDDGPASIAAAVPTTTATTPTTTTGGDPRSGSTTSTVPPTTGPALATPTTGTTSAATSTATTVGTSTTVVTTSVAPPGRAAPVTTAPVTAAPTAPPPSPPTPPTPPPPAPPATTAAPTTTVKPPKMIRFTVAPGPALLCGAGTPRHFEWVSTGATAGVLTVAGVPRNVGPSDTYDLCASSGATAKIVVSGPGGTAQRSLVVP